MVCFGKSVLGVFCLEPFLDQVLGRLGQTHECPGTEPEESFLIVPPRQCNSGEPVTGGAAVGRVLFGVWLLLLLVWCCWCVVFVGGVVVVGGIAPPTTNNTTNNCTSTNHNNQHYHHQHHHYHHHHHPPVEGIYAFTDV